MTWKEFKEEVERQGVNDTDEVFYIDLYPEDGVLVGVEEDRGDHRAIHIT